MGSFYGRMTGADAPREEERNGSLHLVGLTATKIADGLIDPKLVLAWLLNALGSPAALIGALVPVREAGALLPQLAIARWLERSGTRKWVWVAGSAVQGLAALAMGLAALTLEGVAAGMAIVGCLAVLALARSLCSVSYKDLLADSVEKQRRGAVSGAAASAASTVVLIFALCLATGVLPLTTGTVGSAILCAGWLWFIGALLVSRVGESEREPAGSGDRAEGAEPLLAPLGHDRQLRLFIASRACLTTTALAPPFLLLLAEDTGTGGGLGSLGPLILASAAASILSAYVWGRLSDRSSRQTLALSGALAALILGAAAGFGGMTGGIGGVLGAAAAIFLAQIAYEGVRMGRKIHLTDMASDGNRARYTALSNTIIGVVLLAGGGVGVVADLFGTPAAVGLLASLAALSVPFSLSVSEVQKDEATAE